MTTNQKEALNQVQSGNLKAFEFLYEAYFKKIYSFIFFKTLHKETTEDLVSRTFIKALEHIQSFNPNKSSFPTWIFTIAKRVVIDHYRTYKSTLDINDCWDLPSNENIFDSASNNWQLEKIKQELQKLKPNQRELVIMRVWQNLSYQEISQITGKTENSLKMAFSRTIRNLRPEILVIMILLRTTFVP